MVLGVCRIRVVSGFDFELEVTKKYLYCLLVFFKFSTSFQCQMLIDLVCYNRKVGKDFVLIYNLLSVHRNIRVRVVTPIISICSLILTSCQNLFLSSSWLEREVFDFFGLFFVMNMDLRRLLLDYGFSGFPLRKDYPTGGYVQVFFDNEQDRVSYKKRAVVFPFT